MPPPPRSAGGHRLYNDDDLKRMTFIRRARGLGFTVAEVRGLLELVDSGAYTWAEVKDLTLAHRSTVRQKIADLERLDVALGDMAVRCKGGTGQDCVIFDSLFGQRLAGAAKARV
jgi:MerR family mercuric resistance operon transcriptional regulator